MVFFRRRLLLATSGLVASVALAACSTANTVPSQVATDVQLIASGLSAAIAAVAAIPGVPAATVTQLQGYLATIQTDAAQVASATASASTSTVQEIATTVQAVADVALPLIPGGAVAVPLINAAVSLLPSILTAFGITSATKRAPVYTPDQARLILRAAAAKH